MGGGTPALGVGEEPTSTYQRPMVRSQLSPAAAPWQVGVVIASRAGSTAATGASVASRRPRCSVARLYQQVYRLDTRRREHDAMIARDRVQPPRERLPGLVGRLPANRCSRVTFPVASVPLVARSPTL